VTWLHNLWFNYAWSSDKGNGPEAIQEALIVAALIPAVRRYVKRELAKAHDELHRKLDHIIKHHPDIPDLPKETDHEVHPQA
jgi:hypothetical protein